MNLLLISFSFPPAGGVGVLRALSLARYLPASGIRVDVLTTRNAPAVGKDLALLQLLPATVTVHRSFTPDLPFAVRKAIKKIISGRASAPAPAAPVAAQPSGGGNLLRRLVDRLLLPDPQVGWLPFALRAATRIIGSRKIDAVLITVPPFSSVRLVSLLRRRFPDLPIVLDFRDEWLSSTMQLVSFSKNERALLLARTMEADAVRDATAVVAVTPAARGELLARYPGLDPARFLCVPNGFDPRPTLLPRDPRAAGSRITLTYLGSVYGSTDPTTLVEAVLQLPSSLRDRLLLRFIGHIETAAYRQTLERLGSTVELHGFIPQAQALQATGEADYLLLLTHDPINVSAKFYDYLGTGKPIVAAVHPDGDVRRLIEQTGSGLWVDINQPAAIRDMLAGILAPGPRPLPVRAEAAIAGFHRASLAALYARHLQTLAAAGDRSPQSAGHSHATDGVKDHAR